MAINVAAVAAKRLRPKEYIVLWDVSILKETDGSKK
jgi:hypothetical protein